MTLDVNPGFCEHCGGYLRPDQGEAVCCEDGTFVYLCADCKRIWVSNVSMTQAEPESSLMAGAA